MENQIHGQETKKRSQFLTQIFHNIARMQNERWLNWQGEVLIDEINKDGSFTARNYAYKPVIIKGIVLIKVLMMLFVDPKTPVHKKP